MTTVRTQVFLLLKRTKKMTHQNQNNETKYSEYFENKTHDSCRDIKNNFTNFLFIDVNNFRLKHRVDALANFHLWILMLIFYYISNEFYIYLNNVIQIFFPPLLSPLFFSVLSLEFIHFTGQDIEI